jgi:D-glycero-D-manno-heptose 1,7-bisphosphate phosphatase
MTQRPAIFLDRDGTIIKDVGYIKDPSQVDFFPFTVQALKALQEHYTLIIITNQSGIAKGLITKEEADAVNQHIELELKANGVTIAQTYVCPHSNADRCFCKKPSPFYIKLAAIDHTLNLPASFMIGDHPSDVECAMNADVWPIYLLTGHGEKHRKELKFNAVIKNDLREAADYILSHNQTIARRKIN